MRTWVGSMLMGLGVAWAEEPPPIIDMHLHAYEADMMGPPPLAMCTPWPEFPHWDPEDGPFARTFIGMQKDPPCDDPVWSPETDQALIDQTVAIMERHNIRGVLSGPPDVMPSWLEAAPGRFIPGMTFAVGQPWSPPPAAIRAMAESGRVAVMGEVVNQYFGVAPEAEAMAPYWALAEELDLPVALHMGPGPPGATYIETGNYRARLSNPLLLEDVLARHPKLRVHVMHAGFPFLDETLALLYAHPQVYVGVGVIVYSRPRADFYRYLEALVDAGFGKRIMFGSDQMVWPGTIERSLAVIEEAPFLDEEQKRDILYNNAARFLRLSDEQIDRDHGRR